jgi:acyl-CoA synthetase (AMP-forming)/AMP-acid ligase II
VRHCVASLAVDKLPDRILYTDALPRLGTGKLDRARLKSIAAAHVSGRPA